MTPSLKCAKEIKRLVGIHTQLPGPIYQDEAKLAEWVAQITGCDRLLESRDRLLAVLKEIERGEGAYSRDPLTHAENCIESMKAIARAVLAKAAGGAE